MMVVNPDEPQMARYVKGKIMVKDHHYYKKQDNSWNNPAQTDQKLYKQFHQQQDAGKPIIQEKLKREAQDAARREDYHKQAILSRREREFGRHTNRVEERMLLENKSKQRYNSVEIPETSEEDEEFNSFLARKQQSSRYVRQNENSWNKLNNLSKKYIKQYLTPSVVKGEEQMVEFVQKVIEQENQEVEREKKRIEQIRRDIKETLKNKMEHNSIVSKKIGVQFERISPAVSTPKSKATWDFLSGLDNNSQAKPESDQQSTSVRTADVKDDKSATNSAKIESSFFKFGINRSLIGPDIDRLSIPKQIPLKNFESAQSDLKGSLIKNIGKGGIISGSVFNHQLVAQSKLLRDVTGTNLKTLPNRAQNRSSPNLITYKMNHRLFSSSVDPVEDFKRALNIQDDFKPYDKDIEDTKEHGDRFSTRQNVMNEIDAFEKKFCQEPKPVNYPRKKLENIYKSANLATPYYMKPESLNTPKALSRE